VSFNEAWLDTTPEHAHERKELLAGGWLQHGPSLTTNVTRKNDLLLAYQCCRTSVGCLPGQEECFNLRLNNCKQELNAVEACPWTPFVDANVSKPPAAISATATGAVTSREAGAQAASGFTVAQAPGRQRAPRRERLQANRLLSTARRRA
jgi:hypothetical protein